MASAATGRTTPVWLFVPNLIGYVRILSALAAFPLAFSPTRWHYFFWLYGVSYALDAVDGVAARALGQTSRFGAVLDMVTDRFCTAGLLAVLARLLPDWSAVFVFLLILDISSHWVQMYRCGGREGEERITGEGICIFGASIRKASANEGRQTSEATAFFFKIRRYCRSTVVAPNSSLLAGHASHKAIKDEPALLKFYYTAPYALFWVCFFNELFLSCVFMLGHKAEVEAAT